MRSLADLLVLVMRFEAGSAAELQAIRSQVETAVAEERAKLANT